MSFVGITKIPLDGTTLASLKTQALWRLKRISVINDEIVEDFAKGGNFVNIWDDRNTIFPPIAVPFVNRFSVQFDGVNDSLIVADDATLEFGRLETWSFSWFAKSSDTTAFTFFEKVNSNRGYRIYHLGASNIEISFRGVNTGDRIRVKSSSAVSAVSDGSFHHYAITYDGSSNASGVTLYVDGILEPLDIVNDTLVNDPSNGGDLRLASRSTGADYFRGNMDEWALWDVELTALSVAKLAAATFELTSDSGDYTESASLITWFRMGDGDTFPIITDNEGANDGTMTNMTAGDIETVVP